MDDFHQIKAFGYIGIYVLQAAIHSCTPQYPLLLFGTQVGSRQIIIQLAAGFHFRKDQRFPIQQHNIQLAITVVCQTVPPVAGQDLAIPFFVEFDCQCLAPAAQFKVFGTGFAKVQSRLV